MKLFTLSVFCALVHLSTTHTMHEHGYKQALVSDIMLQRTTIQLPAQTAYASSLYYAYPDTIIVTYHDTKRVLHINVKTRKVSEHCTKPQHILEPALPLLDHISYKNNHTNCWATRYPTTNIGVWAYESEMITDFYPYNNPLHLGEIVEDDESVQFIPYKLLPTGSIFFSLSPDGTQLASYHQPYDDKHPWNIDNNTIRQAPPAYVYIWNLTNLCTIKNFLNKQS